MKFIVIFAVIVAIFAAFVQVGAEECPPCDCDPPLGCTKPKVVAECFAPCPIKE